MLFCRIAEHWKCTFHFTKIIGKIECESLNFESSSCLSTAEMWCNRWNYTQCRFQQSRIQRVHPVHCSQRVHMVPLETSLVQREFRSFHHCDVCRLRWGGRFTQTVALFASGSKVWLICRGWESSQFILPSDRDKLSLFPFSTPPSVCRVTFNKILLWPGSDSPWNGNDL